jgi:hypothetical protein
MCDSSPLRYNKPISQVPGLGLETLGCALEASFGYTRQDYYSFPPIPQTHNIKTQHATQNPCRGLLWPSVCAGSAWHTLTLPFALRFMQRNDRWVISHPFSLHNLQVPLPGGAIARGCGGV